MKYLITGAAGFIGSHIYEKLIHDQYPTILAVDDFSHPSKNPVKDKVQRLDISNPTLKLEELIKAVDVVFHLAAQIHVGLSIEKPVETMKTNYVGTQYILDYVNKWNKKMVFASTSEVYGTAQQDFIDEHHPLDCQSPYAASKVAADRLCYAYHKTYGTKVAILRNFNTFGKWQNDGSYGGVIAIFTRKALSGEPLEIFGDGRQTRDYMNVQDAMKGYFMLSESNYWGHPVNIGSGKEISINELAEMIKAITKSNSPIVHKEPRAGEVRRLCADIKVAKSLGFESTTDFEKDLVEYIEWYKTTIKK